MKKIILLLIFALAIVFYSNAQDETEENGFISKRGVNILPEAGDIAIGIDARPVFEYFGNMFSGNPALNTIRFFNANNAIYAKYFLDDKTAVRVSFSFYNETNTDIAYVTKDVLPVPDDQVTVEDKQIVKTSDIRIGAGYEMRRGVGRVQGFYGPELFFELTKGSMKYEYGNNYSPDFPNPETNDFLGTTYFGNDNYNPATGERITESKDGTGMGFGLGGFIGAEYFFVPKLSVGGQFGWGLKYTKIGKGKEIKEQWTGTEIKKVTEKKGGGKEWLIDTNTTYGTIFLLFHF